MKKRSGILYCITAALTGYAAFYMMMQTVNGSPFPWWGPIMLGSAILLMVVGIRSLAPRLTVGWAALIAAATPLAICTDFGTWPLRCWVFAAVLALSTCFLLKAETILKHGDVAAFALSLVLLASWIAISIGTFHTYLSKPQVTATAAALVVLLLYWVLTLSVVIRSGTTIFRSR